MSKIIISTESGSDLPYKIVIPNNIEIIPMHVTFGKETKLDGSFDIHEIDEYFKKYNVLPTTSAPNPQEYIRHFKAIFQKYPHCKIIHISYSSKLSASYQNSLVAINSFKSGMIASIDSQAASIGAGVLVIKACESIKKYSHLISFEELVSFIKKQRDKICCDFLPDKLDYLKSGGRISGVAHISASVLGIKPSIKLKNGELVAGKKYRGNINRVAEVLLNDFVNTYNPTKDYIVIAYTYAVSKPLLFALKRQAHKLGFLKSWCFQLGSAVTSHTGPIGIGFAGLGIH